jgi:hypothetical protein
MLKNKTINIMKKTITAILLMLSIAGHSQKAKTDSANVVNKIDSTLVPVINKADLDQYIFRAFGVMNQNGQFQKGYFLQSLSKNQSLSNDQYEQVAGLVYETLVPMLEDLYNQANQRERSKLPAKPKK